MNLISSLVRAAMLNSSFKYVRVGCYVSQAHYLGPTRVPFAERKLTRPFGESMCTQKLHFRLESSPRVILKTLIPLER